MEKLMQYVWQHRLFMPAGLTTVDGRRISVINPGWLNSDAGPDFFNATVMIDGEKWVGNVEIHVKASDWFRHGHDKDRAYDSVILHVVDMDDTDIRRHDGSVIPQMRLPCSPTLNSDFHKLIDTAPAELPCSPQIKKLSPLYITDWLTALAHERLHEKVERIESLLAHYANDWEEVCYITVARSLGFGINSEPFERLARATPMRFMRKHADSITAIEAILFGQSGTLSDVRSTDSYVMSLKQEYEFMAAKFGMRRPDNLGWKLARMRPHNFPFRRIALLAGMIHRGFSLMSRILDVSNAEEARALFDISLTGYWSNHFTFNGAATSSPIGLSRASVDILVINSVVPMMYAYSIATGDSGLSDRAISILEELKPESNTIVRMFENAGIKCDSAFTSQAMIQLRRQYCEKRKCLYCRIGHRSLSATAVRAH